VHFDAGFGQSLGVYVAACAGAQEDDVLQAGAVARDHCGQVGMVNDCDLGASEQGRKRFTSDVGCTVDREGQVARTQQPLRNVAEGRIGIDEHGA